MNSIKKILMDTMEEFGVLPDTYAVGKLCHYYELLVEWNEKINLTALTEPSDVALKHFTDSLMLLKYVDIPEYASMIDVGTGAGFPGLVLKTARPDIRLTLLDSLNKRLMFLDHVCAELGIIGVELVHSRAEDGSRTKLRDSFDYSVSRAVAPLNILCEYDMPYVRPGGSFIAMKGREGREELGKAENAVRTLGGEIGTVSSFDLGSAGGRCIIEIKKTAPTPEEYPRKSKAIKNKPL